MTNSPADLTFQPFISKPYDGDFSEFNFFVHSSIDNNQLQQIKLLFEFALDNSIDFDFRGFLYHVVDSGNLDLFDFFLNLNNEYDFYSFEEVDDVSIHIIENGHHEMIIKIMELYKENKQIDLFYSLIEQYADSDLDSWLSNYLSLKKLNNQLQVELNNCDNTIKNINNNTSNNINDTTSKNTTIKENVPKLKI